tara:strand:+ start:121 stop:633 length:513 start_codon:yes stop_codon:yes gene_type:complete
MACLLTTGYQLGCRDSIGGIQEIYIANFSSGATYSLDANDNITGVGGVTASYYTFEQEMETGQFDQTGEYSTEMGTVFFTQDVTVMLHKNDAALRNQLLVLSQANMSVIILDQRGEYWLIGYQNGVRTTAGAMNTGKAFGDMNGVTITLQGKEPEPAYRIDDISIFTITV